MRQSGMEKRAFGQQKSDRFQEQKPMILMGNSDLEKRNFLTAKFVAFVEPPSPVKITHQSRQPQRERRKGGI